MGIDRGGSRQLEKLALINKFSLAIYKSGLIFFLPSQLLIGTFP